MENQNSKTGKNGLLLLGITYDDILVLPRYSNVLPKEVSTKTRLTRNIILNIPLVSASMDTVTGAEMAIAMARAGGIGIIHKNMSIADQAKAVKSVKLKQIKGLIPKPFVARFDERIGDILKRMEEKGIHHFPVVDIEETFLGLISLETIKFHKNNPKILVSEIMLKLEKCTTAKIGTNFEEAKKIMENSEVGRLPTIDSDGKLKGLYTYKDVIDEETYPEAIRDKEGRYVCGAAIGVGGDTLERVKALVKSWTDVITIDTAHGHSQGVADQIKEIKNLYPDLQIIAGNVATAEGAKFLADAGADAVKVGIGPGSICTTRVIAGIGVPQVTAVIEVSNALAGTGIPVIADGGIRYSGDMVKAIVAGADSIMAGSLFAGTDESPGDVEIFEGRKVKTYRGMGSLDAMKDGSADRYLQDPEVEFSKLVPEGIEGRVLYKGSVKDLIYQYIGGLRAGMGYTGSHNIKDLQNADFVQITSAGMKESHPHDVTITKDAPNYSK